MQGAFFHGSIQHFVPLAHNRSAMRAWVFPSPFPAHRSLSARLTRPLADPIRKRLVRRSVSRIMREDIEVCERLQEVAHQIVRAPMHTALEERIGWFERSYRLLLAAGEGAIQ